MSSETNEEENKRLVICTHDKEDVQVPAKFIKEFNFLTNYLKVYNSNDNGSGHKRIVLPENAPVTHKTHLRIILDFMERHQLENLQEMKEAENDYANWMNGFFEDMRENLVDAINSASFLGATSFVNNASQFIKEKILAFKNPEDAAKYFCYDLDEMTQNQMKKWEVENEEVAVEQKKIEEEESKKRAEEEAKKRAEEEEARRKEEAENMEEYDDNEG